MTKRIWNNRREQVLEAITIKLNLQKRFELEIGNHDQLLHAIIHLYKQKFSLIDVVSLRVEVS